MTFFGFGRPSRRRPGTPARPGRAAGPAPAALMAAIAAVGAALLAGCAGSSPGHADGLGRALPSAASHGAPSAVPSTTPVSGPSTPAAGSTLTPAPPATGAPPAGTAACTSGGLQVSLGAPNGAAGSIYYPIDFRNVSGAACSMYGYPGVSFVAAPGTGQLGGAAARNSTFGPSLVTLAPGAVAHASVQVVVAQSYPASLCKPVTAHYLRVYPPGQVVPLYASLTALTCTGDIPGRSTLGIYVVRPGATGP
jgi:Protein of unknown function (DUF4232)